MEKLEHIASDINQFKYDIRAEVLLGDLLQRGMLDSKHYWVNYKGQFTRSYRTDILRAKIIDFHFDTTSFLDIDISRDGLYDMLPEALTHHTQNNFPNKGVDTMIREYRVNRQQEKAARDFFSPFENEFFSVGVDIEVFESSFFRELNASSATELLHQLWGISSDFSQHLIAKFIRLLPYAYKIVGDIALTTEILSRLLDEQVKISDNEYEQYMDFYEDISLGDDISLGVNFVIGRQYDDYTKHIVLEIGPIENTVFSDYILEGERSKFIKLFCEYFYPIEVEVQVRVLASDRDKHFEIDKEQKSFLGYNTYI